MCLLLSIVLFIVSLITKSHYLLQWSYLGVTALKRVVSFAVCFSQGHKKDQDLKHSGHP